jgi:cellulose biosynthesis protein BcsQ/uncharacterized protein YjbK
VTVFAVYSIKGGVGKTTTAVNLAWLSAADGRRTVLWDLDAQGAASFAFRIRPKVAGGARKLLRADDAVAAALRGTDHERLDLLPADPSFRHMDEALDAGRARLTRVIDALRRDYEHVFLDCPPGVTRLAENVFEVADILIVPTVPTVLALRTLSDLVRRLRRLGGAAPRVLAFQSMADHRKALHRRIEAWAGGHRELFLDADIPYASVIEQMGVQRRPVGVYAPRSEAAAAYERLWRAVCERLQSPRDDVGPIKRSVRDLLVELDPERRAGAEPIVADAADRARAPDRALDRAPDRAPDRAAAPGAPRTEHEYKLRLRGAADFEALMAHVPDAPARDAGDVVQVNHVFDTPRRELSRHGYALRLREEQGVFTITLKGPVFERDGDPALASKAEEEVRIDASWAVEVLGGRRSPLTTLARRARGPGPAVVEAARALVGSQPLERVGSFRNVRQRVGPVALPSTGRALDVVLEFDRTEFPGGRTEYEVEVEVDAADAEVCGPALQRLFADAGVPWTTSTSKAGRFFESLEGGAAQGAAQGRAGRPPDARSADLG